MRVAHALTRSPLGTAAYAALLLLSVNLVLWKFGRESRLPLEHSNVAVSLISGAGFGNPYGPGSGPTAWVPPVVPVLLAVAFGASNALHVDGRYPFVALNLIAAAGAVFLVFRFCIFRWSLPARVVFLAAFLGYGLCDQDFLTSTGPIALAECALLLAGLVGAWREPGGTSPWVMLFFANTLLALTHPGLAMAGIAAAFVLGLAVRRANRAGPARWLKSASMSSVAALVVGVGPWALRNHAVFGEWVAAKSNGYFELVLSEVDTDDGILTESSIVAGHPAANARIQAAFIGMGEKRFLEPYRRQASAIFAADGGLYAAFALDRFLNAVVYSKATSDTEAVQVQFGPGEAARLIGRGRLLAYGPDRILLWPPSRESESVERGHLEVAGIAHVDSVLADWMRAQAAIRARMTGVSAVLAGFFLAGFPSVCCLVTLLLGIDFAPRLALGAAAIYLVALVPNVLITHDIRHQGNFVLIFAVLAAAPVEAILRQRARRKDRLARQDLDLLQQH